VDLELYLQGSDASQITGPKSGTLRQQERNTTLFLLILEELLEVSA